MNPLLLTYGAYRNRASWRGAGGPTPAPEVSGLGFGTAGINALTTYLRGLSTEERAAAMLGQRTAQLQAVTGRAVSGAEALALLQVASAQLRQETAAVRPQVSSQAPPPQTTPPASNAGVYIGVGVIAALAGGAYLYRKRLGF